MNLYIMHRLEQKLFKAVRRVLIKKYEQCTPKKCPLML